MSEPTFLFVLASRECPAENPEVKMGFVPRASALRTISQADLAGLEILPGLSGIV